MGSDLLKGMWEMRLPSSPPNVACKVWADCKRSGFGTTTRRRFSPSANIAAAIGIIVLVFPEKSLVKANSLV